jgi:lanosterol synthase
MAEYKMPRTDLLGWRLKVGEDNHGQHKWVYLPEGPARKEWPQTTMDKYAIGLETVRLFTRVSSTSERRFTEANLPGRRSISADVTQNLPDLPKANTPLEAARNGLTFYKELQADDGHFATEYGGEYFFLRLPLWMNHMLPRVTH